jgi:hypothetical protein
VTSNKRTNVETAESELERELEIRYVRELTISELVFLAFRVFVYTFVGGVFVLLYLVMLGFPLQNPWIFYGLWFIPIIPFMILALGRNHILRNGFKKPNSHRKYLQFSYFWRKAVPILTVLVMFYYVVYGFHDPKYFTFPLIIFFFFTAVYMIFDGILTQEGEIAILFEMLSFSLNNFHEAIQYWKRIAKRIERMLRAGNIQLSSKDLVYYFSKKLLETNDNLSNDLVSIRDWMLGGHRSCFEAIKHINRETKLVPCKRNAFLEWVLTSPDIIMKYVFAGVLIGIVLAINPNSISSILNYFRSFAGG